jgi:hypothetical protein
VHPDSPLPLRRRTFSAHAGHGARIGRNWVCPGQTFLSANKTPAIRRWVKRENVELCFTPVNASWANPIEAQFGPLRTFVMGGSDHPSHPVLARKLQDYLRWRNAHARHPDVLAAQRRERARVRSERQQRWGRPRPRSRAA